MDILMMNDPCVVTVVSRLYGPDGESHVLGVYADRREIPEIYLGYEFVWEDLEVQGT